MAQKICQFGPTSLEGPLNQLDSPLLLGSNGGICVGIVCSFASKIGISAQHMRPETCQY